MKKTVKDFTEEEKEIFADAFYENWEGTTDAEAGSPLPWGCPWLYKKDLEVEGTDIEDMGNKYFEECKSEIDFFINKEREEEDDG